MTEPSARPPRLQLLDILRGVAILGMVVFHVGWDLYYFGYSPIDVTTEPRWFVFQKLVLSSFLLLVGASLVLAHGRGIRWRPYLRRLAILVVAALLVSAGTYWMFPDYFVFFGVLHAIALFSLLALPFLGLDGRVVLLVGAILVGATFSFTDTAFIARPLAWIGFWPVSPETADIVPVFPWFGVTLIGVGLMQVILASPLAPRRAAFHSREPALRGLAVLGRWSLPVYVLHQPLIIGLLYGLMAIAPPAPVVVPVAADPAVSTGFMQTCQQGCGAAGSDAATCERYCSCASDEISRADLWTLVNDPATDPAGQQQLQSIAGLCTAMAK